MVVHTILISTTLVHSVYIPDSYREAGIKPNINGSVYIDDMILDEYQFNRIDGFIQGWNQVKSKYWFFFVKIDYYLFLYERKNLEFQY